MEILYDPKKIKDEFEDYHYLLKKYNKLVACGMEKFLSFLRLANNAYDIKAIPMFHMELLKGNYKEYYSISLDNKKSKWRLLIQMLDNNYKISCPGENEKDFLKQTTIILIRGISEHYEK